MRVLGEEIQKRWGQPIIIENRPGGSMNIGSRACADAPNDGYTICILPVEPLAYNQFLYKKISFDPDKDFEPITNPFFNTQVLVVATSLNVKSLDELAALSKAKPGTLSYIVPSVPLAMFLDKWKRESGADLVRVPFRGGGEAVTSVLSGATPVAFFGLANWTQNIRAGTVRPLAVNGETRSPVLPDVPTLRELGYRQHHPRLFRHRCAGRNAEAGHPQAARRDGPHRQRAGIPPEAADRGRPRAGVRHAGRVRGVPQGEPRRRRAHRQGGGAGAAVENVIHGVDGTSAPAAGVIVRGRTEQ